MEKKNSFLCLHINLFHSWKKQQQDEPILVITESDGKQWSRTHTAERQPKPLDTGNRTQVAPSTWTTGQTLRRTRQQILLGAHHLYGSSRGTSSILELLYAQSIVTQRKDCRTETRVGVSGCLGVGIRVSVIPRLWGFTNVLSTSLFGIINDTTRY